jgi:hypothetical protein
MGQIDADLATDYAERTLYLYDELDASFEPVLINVEQPAQLQTLYLVDTGALGGATGPTYIMRGYDGTLMSLVYWEASIVDSGGGSYAGPGPLSDIVVQSIKGQ